MSPNEMHFGRLTFILTLLVTIASSGLSQTPAPTAAGEFTRVMLTVNPDGSRTEYKFDDANRKAIATTTNPDGKLREKIRYDLDEAGRYSAGQIFGPDGKFRFKSRYKYNSAGRLEEETQMTEKDAVLHKIVYSYDATGKQTGYSIYDGAGKLLNRAIAPSTSPTPKPKK